MTGSERFGPGMAPVLFKVLLYCVLIATLLFVIGSIYLLVTDDTAVIDEQLSLQEIGEAIASVSPEGIIGIGIAVVIATPLIRLLTTTALSLKMGDRIIALITVFSFIAIVAAFLLKTFVV